MKNTLYRINDYSIFRVTNITDTRKFNIYKLNDVEQYVCDDKQQQNLDNTVWFEGEFKTRLNKVWNSEQLLDFDDKTRQQEYAVQRVDIMLRQGYSFLNVFGLHVCILDVNTNTVYLSQIFTEQDFCITSEKELIDGSFWLQQATIYIPITNELLSVQVTQVTYDDIEHEEDSVGKIYNFPYSFVPLVSEQPIPDYICTSITLDDNCYLTIKPYTTLNKTLEKSILDYMELEIANIQLSHVVNYGTEELGYKTIRLTNEDNKYLPITIGLDLSPFNNDTTNNKVPESISVTVTTEILVNSSLLTRTAELTYDIQQTINPLISEYITHPETNFPVEIKVENVIEQQVIQQATETKVVTIQQPIFAELISTDLVIENKNIVFDKITTPSYLVINATKKTEEQLVESKTAIDNTIYFDISELVTPDTNTTYQILDKNNLNIIGKGSVLVNKKES